MSHTPGSSVKTNKTHQSSDKNLRALTRKLKMASTTVLAKAGIASTAFPPSFLTTSTSQLNHFFKAHLCFGRWPRGEKHLHNCRNGYRYSIKY